MVFPIQEKRKSVGYACTFSITEKVNFFSPCLTGEHSDQRQELAGNIPQSVPVENAGHNHVAENNSPHGLKLVAGNNDKPAKASLKEKLEAYKAQVAGVENTGTDKTKGKEAVI